MLILAFVLFAGVEYWGVLTIYQQAEHLKYYTLSGMAVNGGLTAADEQSLRARLEGISKPGTVRIEGSLLKDGREPVLRPGTVSLKIEFTPKIDNFMARTLLGSAPGRPLRIVVGGEAVSEKIP